MPRGGKANWRGELRSAVPRCQQGGAGFWPERRPHGERVVNSTTSWPAADAATAAGRSLRSGSGQQHSGGSLGWNEACPSLCHLTALTAESGGVGRDSHGISPPLRFATDRPSASLAADCETGRNRAKHGETGSRRLCAIAWKPWSAYPPQTRCQKVGSLDERGSFRGAGRCGA